MKKDSFYKVLEDKHRGNRKLIKERLKIYTECISPLKTINPKPKALDLGCGRGEWLELLVENGFDATGIDQDESMLRLCRENKLHVLQQDALEYLKSIPPQSIELVSAFHFVEHIAFDKLQEMIQLVWKILKKGGLFIIETPNPENIMVASKTFYMDPTHKNPLPSELLLLALKYYGFSKAKVLRLQEEKDILLKKDFALLDVITGVSPDYGIIAQKEAPAEVLTLFQSCFDKQFGVSLEEVTNKYDIQIKESIEKVEGQMRLLQNEFAETKKQNEMLTQQLVSITNSNSWKLTKPLRLLMKFLRDNKYKANTKYVLRKLKKRLNRFPRLKFFLVKILRKFPYLYARLKYINEYDEPVQTDSNGTNKNLSYREEFFYNIKKRKTKAKSAKKLAYISPLPPEKSGISFYSADLLEVLKDYYDIELIAADKDIVDNEIRAAYKVRDINYFVQNSDNYSKVLYHFGNSPFHEHMFDLLKIVPGIVVLHDFYLSHIVEKITLSQDPKAGFFNALYKSHGYKALYELLQTNNREEIIWKYPCNLEVLQNATAVVSHSNHSKELAKKHYGSGNAAQWHIIPLLRKQADKKDKAAVRKKFSIPEDAFVVCSFGQLGKNKLNHRLLDAWANSSLAKDKKCKLIFVGEYSDPHYRKKLIKLIKENSLEQSVHVTGWVSDDEYKNYLCIADTAVQLRAYSRGETSAAVLDCMNYALAVIVNAHGAMKDLPQEALCMIEDDFSDERLSHALQTLYNDKNKRETISRNAQKIIQEQHTPQKCALMYRNVIENSCAYEPVLENPPQTRQKQLLVDVSAIARTDLKTGIQRVVRSQLRELVKNVSNEYRVEPVYLTQTEGRYRYCYAHEYMAKLLDAKEFTLPDRPIDCYRGDIFYGLDLSGSFILEAARTGLFEAYKAKGVKISFVVYDLLPVLQPQFFPKESEDIHTKWLDTVSNVADSLICISNAVAEELSSWIETHKQKKRTDLEILSLHLGADIQNITVAQGLTAVQKEQLDRLDKNMTFLMVGTIEPRKGHRQVLEAFELLWAEGVAVNLIIVGKRGWMVDNFIQKLTNHPKQNKQLLWLEGIDDAFLKKLYSFSDALIVASEAEGFGLPLIEAAHYNLPVIARDIPVFREVAQNCAYFFANENTPGTIADAIISWKELYKQKKHPLSDNMPYLTWEENAKKLLEVFNAWDA
ncbi:glycosyltransferase [Sulfurimonas sp. NW15]|uniref:glycosyltransferase n=1 Tax=Sulfurimonas sp. NW15 TaxID=2922729 RepID=UPI003DA8D9AD